MCINILFSYRIIRTSEYGWGEHMKDDYKRLMKAAKEMKGLNTATEVADALTSAGYEVSPQTMTNWASRGVSKEGRLNAARVIGCRPHWIEFGDGQMIDSPNVITGINIEANRRHYPVISYVQAGNWREIVDAFEPGDAESYRLAESGYGKHTFGLVIVGNSMEPEFREGDVVFIDPDVVPRPGDFVVARNSEQEATFKKYRPRGTVDGIEVFELVPLNEDYAPMRSDHQPIQIIGTMVEHTRYRRS